jgi:hypothetical protein
LRVGRSEVGDILVGQTLCGDIGVDLIAKLWPRFISLFASKAATVRTSGKIEKAGWRGYSQGLDFVSE